MLDQLTTEESICTNINFDNASGAALAVQHFLGKGHKKNCILQHPSDQMVCAKIFIRGLQTPCCKIGLNSRATTC